VTDARGGPRNKAEAKKATVACEEALEAISARMDGEGSPVSDRDLDNHLAGCRLCRDFEVQVTALGRPAPLTSARPIPEDLVPKLTSMVDPPRRRFARVGIRRPLLHTRRWASGFQWAGATLPAVLAAVAISMGAGSHPHLVPTRPPSPCTAGLVVHHASGGG